MRGSCHIVTLLLVAGLSAGCASSYSPMVQFYPTTAPDDSRDGPELLHDLNREMPFLIADGDFVMSATREGPSCWVSVGSGPRVRELIAALHRSPSWEVRSLGQVRDKYRTMFGLAAEPQTDFSARMTTVEAFSGMLARRLSPPTPDHF
jgi:hypothetical protein